MSQLPPDPSKSVTFLASHITIDAPVATVWDALLDFPSYHLWNPFVRSLAVTDSSFKPLLAHREPKEGDHIMMHVRVPPIGLHDDDKGLRDTKLIVTLVDEENYRISWKAFGFPSWLLRGHRLQELSEEHVNGKMHTVYKSIETFNGLAAWLIRWFMRDNLGLGFRAMAEGLKARSEEVATNARSSI